MERMRVSLVGVVTIASVLMFAGCEASQPRDQGVSPDRHGDSQAAEVLDGSVGCALCIYHMPGISDCVLAAKVGEKVMLVEGVGIDDLGDAHDPKTGLCNVSRKASIHGHIEGDKLVATQISLQP